MEYKNRKLHTHFIKLFILCRYGPGGLVRSRSLRSLASRQAPWKKKGVVKWIPHINTVNQKWEFHSEILGDKQDLFCSRNYIRSKARKICQLWKMNAKDLIRLSFVHKRWNCRLNWKFLGLYSSWPSQLLSNVKGAGASLTEMSSWERETIFWLDWANGEQGSKYSAHHSRLSGLLSS